MAEAGGQDVPDGALPFVAKVTFTSQTVKGLSTTFNYDRNRLLTADSDGVTASYNYDPASICVPWPADGGPSC